MLIFNCTQAAQEFFTSVKNKQKYSPVQDAVSKDFSQDLNWVKDAQGNTPTVLEQWLVHVISQNGKKVLIAISLSCCYGIVLSGIRKGDHQSFLRQFKQHLYAFLPTCAHNMKLGTTATEQQIAARFEQFNDVRRSFL